MAIKEKRKSKGYSQSEICQKLGIPLRTYKRYESTENTKHTYKHDLLETQIDALPKNVIRKDIKKETICVIGAGNVGYPLGALLSTRNKVVFLESDTSKIAKINSGELLIDGLDDKDSVSKIKASPDIKTLNFCDSIIIALPTDFDETIGNLNTANIEKYIDYIEKNNPDATIVIKSTVPIGFTESLCKKYKNLEIIFSPEFLREGNALHDSQYPDRLIFGVKRKNLKNKRMAMILENITNNASKTLFMSFNEAEAVKLFSNTYLAMRIAYMNEIDSFALKNNLCAENIIKGMCADTRIGNFYNNPSFGYGGHCLPKDAKQLSASLNDCELINVISKSNQSRFEKIASVIMKKVDKNSIVGFYKTLNKNLASKEVMNILTKNGYKVILYDKDSDNFEKFVDKCNLIVVNRIDSKISPYIDKVFTRDLFKNN